MKWYCGIIALWWAYSIYMAPKGQASMHNPQSSQPSRTFMVYPIFIIRSLGHFHCSQTPQYSLSIINKLSPYSILKIFINKTYILLIYLFIFLYIIC